LSENTWPRWNSPPIRSFSDPGSRRASQNIIARLPTTNSAMKIQAPRQSSVPAGKNSAAAMDKIHNAALMDSPPVTQGLPSAVAIDDD
jgi:hypothetical protein